VYVAMVELQASSAFAFQGGLEMMGESSKQGEGEAERSDAHNWTRLSVMAHIGPIQCDKACIED
jgi:hypothetical protein